MIPAPLLLQPSPPLFPQFLLVMDKHSGLCWNRRRCPEAPGGDISQAVKSPWTPPAFAGFLWEALPAFELCVAVFVPSTAPDEASNLNICHARCWWLQSSITVFRQQGTHGEQQQEFRATEQRAPRSSGVPQAAPVGIHQLWVWALLSAPLKIPLVFLKFLPLDRARQQLLPGQRFSPVNPCQEGQQPSEWPQH